MICSFMMLQKNYLNTMSMTMSSSHIPSSNVASDSSVNKGTPEDLKGKHTKRHFCTNVTISQISCRTENIFMNIYPLSFSIDEHYLYKEDIFVRNLNWFQPVIIFK